MATAPTTATRARAGIDRLLADAPTLARLAGGRVGLLTNVACRTADGTPTADALARALTRRGGGGLIRLFGAEHGFGVDVPAGASVADAHDPSTGLIVTSLYGSRRTPDPETLAELDAVIVDLRCVGVRCYSYGATAGLLATAAREQGLAIVLCDRANPLGPATAGPRPALRSFLAYFDVPFVHGQTIAQLVRDTLRGGAGEVDVFAADGEDAAAADVTWVAPSPALVTRDAVRLYPGLVLLEGTTVSEGRGTPWPFGCAIAPGLDGEALAGAVERWDAGIAATPVAVAPRAGAHAGTMCNGARFTLTRPRQFNAFDFGLRLLAHLATSYRGFDWRAGRLQPLGGGPPHDAAVIDMLLGDDALRRAIDAGRPVDRLYPTGVQPTRAPST